MVAAFQAAVGRSGSRRQVYGTVRRAILTHSPQLHESQARGFASTTLAKGREEAGRAGRHPRPRQRPPVPRQGRSRDRGHHQKHLGAAGHHLAGGRREPPGPAAYVGIDQAAGAALAEEIFGRRPARCRRPAETRARSIPGSRVSRGPSAGLSSTSRRMSARYSDSWFEYRLVSFLRDVDPFDVGELVHLVRASS